MDKRIILIAIGCLACVACGDSESFDGVSGADSDFNNQSGVNNVNNVNNANNVNNVNNSNNVFIPEVEEFVVQQVATTDAYVFVPNSTEESTTVALIDGRDLSVKPVRVGLDPVEVVAADSEDRGPVAYVLCEGSSSVAVIHAEETANDGRGNGFVKLLNVPPVLNAITIAPDGKHALAYIDPKRPFETQAVSSLQVMSLIRAGEEAGEEQAFQLTVTRLIRDIEFTNTGDVFLVGNEGVQRFKLDEIESDALIRPMNLNLNDGLYPLTDLEVEVADDASFMVVRSSNGKNITIYELPESGIEVGESREVALDDIPTDVDLLVDGDTRRAVVAIRDSAQVALLDIDAILATPIDQEPVVQIVDVDSKEAGLIQLTPDRQQALLYSTLPQIPSLAVYDIMTDSLRSYTLRNQIRSVAVSPDSTSAVVVHKRQEALAGSPTDPNYVFRSNHGVTLFDMASGFTRPVALQGEPIDFVMTPNSDDQTQLYVLIENTGTQIQGLMHLNMATFRSDFVRLPRKPEQLGVVAGKVFVAQEDSAGRITFFDVDTQSQRTISGYELNAGID